MFAVACVSFTAGVVFATFMFAVARAQEPQAAPYVVTVDDADVNHSGHVDVIDLQQAAQFVNQYSSYYVDLPGGCVSRGTEYELSPAEAEMLNLINAYRAENGTGPLAISPPLQKSATWKSHDMDANAYFAHDDLQRTWTERIEDCGQPLNVILGENLGLNHVSAQTMFDNWVLAPGHNANMLNPGYHAIGIALDYHDWGWVWTTDFSGATVEAWEPSPTSTSTSTPTAHTTATPTATITTANTSTNTATPTLAASATSSTVPSSTTTPTSAYSIENLIADSTGAHDFCIPVPDSFDWKDHGRYGDQTRDAGDDQLTGWGVAENGCGESNRTVEIRNVRVYAFTGSWIQVANQATWCVTSNVETNGAYVDIPCGQAWVIPADRAIHWATSRVGIPANTICMATFYEARGDALVNAGADWIDNGNVAGDHVVGRFIRLTSAWRTIGASGCSEAQLTARALP